MINERGRDLIDFADKNDLFIINGRFPSDTPACFTYINTQGKSVIDIVLCNSEALFKVLDLKVYNTVTLSDHLPVLISMNFITNIENFNSDRIKIKWKNSKDNDFYNYMLYSNNVSKINLNLNEMANNLSNTIKQAAKSLKMINFEKNKNAKFNINNPWFDTECYKAKKIIRNKAKILKVNEYPSSQVKTYREDRFAYFKLL